MLLGSKTPISDEKRYRYQIADQQLFHSQFDLFFQVF